MIYVIASKASQPYLSECQIIGEFLEKNAPDISVKYVIKDQSEWKKFLDSVCRSYGFSTKACPVIYTLEGQLIGTGNQFVELVKSRYEKAPTITKEHQKGRTRQNIAENEERMRKKNHGNTMGEEIEKNLSKIPQQKIVKLIDDAFYNVEQIKSIPFHVRRTDYLRDEQLKGLTYGRFYDVPDEVLIQEQETIKIQEAEAQRDKTFEEFLEMFQDHIEGKVDANARTAHRPGTGDAHNEEKKRVQSRGEKDAGDERSRKNESIQSMGRVSSQNSRLISAKTPSQNIRLDVPTSCHLQLNEKLIIQKLNKNYFLIAHPYPTIEGEMILAQIRPFEGREEEELKLEEPLVYQDFSLRKRFYTMAKPKNVTALQKKKAQENDQELSQLQNLEIDLEAPLSSLDWNQLSIVIQEINAMAWVQILPANQKSSFPLQFNVMHILPSSKIPFPKVPLDIMIKNKIDFQKKYEKQLKGKISRDQQILPHAPVHPRHQEAKEAGIVQVDEYLFPHGIFQINPAEMNTEGLKFAYGKLSQFLGVSKYQDSGITLIITPQWMFLGFINQPYHIEPEKIENGKILQHQVPIFLDGYSYAGIANLQEVKQKWPETAVQANKKHEILEALTLQADFVLLQ